MQNSQKIINITLKVLLAALFVYVLFFNPENTQGKGMLLRAPIFLAPVYLLPLWAYFRKWENYPHLADIFLILPFITDTVGNVFGLFDSWKYYDDVMHFLNWVFLICAFHGLKKRNNMVMSDRFLLGTAMGALLIVIWEILEFAVSNDGFGTVNGLQLTYVDTITDLIYSTSGGILGSWIGIKIFKSKA